MAKKQILRLLKEGDVIGYRSLISNDRYHCSAVAIEDSSVCFIPRSAFNNLIKENSAVSYEVMKLLSDNLKKQNGKSFLLPKKCAGTNGGSAPVFKASYGINTKTKR